MERKHFYGLSTFQILTMLRRGIFYFFLAIYLKEYLGLSNTEMTLLATLSMIANILGQSLVWGRLSDHFQKRRSLIVFGELFAAAGYLAIFFLHRSLGLSSGLRAAGYAIIIGFTVVEFFWSSSNLAWTALIADLTSEAERSKVMGNLQLVGGLGNMLGITAAGFLYQEGAGFWDGSLFYICSGIMVFGIFAMFVIPESYADLKVKTPMSASGQQILPMITEVDTQNQDKKELELDSFKSKRSNHRNNIKKDEQWEKGLFIWLLAVLAIINIGGNSVIQLIQLHVRLADTFAASDQTVSYLRLVDSFAIMVGGLITGTLAKKYGNTKLLFLGFMLMFVGLLSLPSIPSLLIFYMYMGLHGLSRVWIQTSSYSLVTKIVPLSQRGKIMAYYNATFYLAWGLGGTMIAGPIADTIVASGKPDSYAYSVTFYVAAFIVLLGMLMFLFLRPKSYKSLLTPDSKKIEVK